MDTQQLEIFLDLVKTGSFSETAKNIFRTQPAVSIALRKLEAELGVRLVERGVRHSRPTPEGELLRPQIADILKQIRDMKFQSSLLGKKPKGSITIATIHSVGLYEISDTIKLFIKKYRDIRLHLLYESSQKIYELVEKREVDFGIVAYPVSGGLINVLPVSTTEMALIASPALGLKKRKLITIGELQGMDFVAFSENVPTRKAVDEVLAKAKVKVEIRFANENIETIKKAVEVGLGVSILPLKAIEKDEARQRFDVLRIKGSPLMRPIGIVKSAKHPLSKAAELFVNALLKTAGAHRRPTR